MTSASSWASAARGWISSRKSEPCVEARRRSSASGLFRATGVLAGCGTGVLAGCVAGVSAGCATGVPGAVGPARSPVLLPVCLLAVPPVFLLAAEQVFLLAALLGFLLAVPPVFRAPSGPPARSPSAPRASLGASVRSPARPCGPAGALHSGGSWCALIGQAHFTCSPRTPQLLGTQPISHAIPLSTFHVLKDERWNCNVFCLG